MHSSFVGLCFLGSGAVLQGQEATKTATRLRRSLKQWTRARRSARSRVQALRLTTETNEELLERISLDQPRRLFRVSDEPVVIEGTDSLPVASASCTDNSFDTVETEKLAALHASSAQLRETVERLGLTEAVFGGASRAVQDSERSAGSEISFAQISVMKCVYTAALAWCFSWLLWNTMGHLIVKFEGIGTISDLYVVQRLTTVFRALIVASFAMGAGLSFFTGTGLLLLGGRVVLNRWQQGSQEQNTEHES
ncbi:hypothetical protein F1559_001363 [Cyanidiococcus yangmingshanensis]|uniref:Transmembrane protein n=1 Tax=Cyanidiococcus yangmingshanensis TaxID=2690220 RepID=A0A7J7IRG1_9RHOD|nr:hypothetical protein F1559_001363 [Cyanidiococcus yangmingshanensis]